MDIFSSFLVGKSFQSYIMSHREVTLVALSRITPTADNLDTLRDSCREWLMKKEEQGRHWEDYLADTIAVKLLEGTNEIRNACWTYVFTGEPAQNNANGKFDVARSLSGLVESGVFEHVLYAPDEIGSSSYKYRNYLVPSLQSISYLLLRRNDDGNLHLEETALGGDIKINLFEVDTDEMSQLIVGAPPSDHFSNRFWIDLSPKRDENCIPSVELINVLRGGQENEEIC